MGGGVYVPFRPEPGFFSGCFVFVRFGSFLIYCILGLALLSSNSLVDGGVGLGESGWCSPSLVELLFVVIRLREEWSWEGSTGLSAPIYQGAGKDQWVWWDWWDCSAMGGIVYMLS